jgi:predicted nucleotidyltransferase
MERLTSPEQLFECLHSSGLLEKYGIRKIGVFGSFARREVYQDIDLLLEDEEINWKALADFRDEFQLITGQKIDIMVKKYAEPLILRTALRDIQYETLL